MSEETALRPHKTVLIVAAVNPIEQDQQRRTVKNSNNLPKCRILWPPPVPNITTNWGFDFCEKNVLSKLRPCKIAATCIKVITKINCELEQLADKKTSSLTRLVFAMSADMMWSCTFNRCWGKQSWKYHVHQSSVNLNQVFCVFISNDVVGTHRPCEPKNDHKQDEELWLVKMPSRLDVSGQFCCWNIFFVAEKN